MSQAAAGGLSSTTALSGSTEEAQFHTPTASADEDEIVTVCFEMLSSNTQFFLQITAMEESSDAQILTPDALRFLRELHQKFEPERQKLLAKRKVLQYSIDSGEYYPDFDPKTIDIRTSDEWRGAEIPKDLLNRRVEITGPTDRKMVINALNSGAKVFMADFEDSNSPSWRNQLDGQHNLYDAVRKNISYTHPITKQEYTLKDSSAGKVGLFSNL